MSSELPPDVDYGSKLEAIWWAMYAVASLFIFLRFWARFIKRSLGLDDAVMASAWLCFLGDAVVSAYSRCLLFVFEFLQYLGQAGGTRHFMYLTPAEQQYNLKLIQIALAIGIGCTGLGKIAIGITILRIIGNTSKWERWVVKFVIIMTIVTSVVDVFLALFRCGDPRATWDYVLAAKAKCLDQRSTDAYNTFTNAWQVLCDFCFSIIPMSVVWRLRMPLRRRLYLIAALGLTLVTGGCAIAKAVYAGILDVADITGGLFNALVWFGVEAMLIVVCGSVPSLHPLWERFVKRPQRGYSSQGSSYRTWASNRGKVSRLGSQEERSLTVDNESTKPSNISTALLTGNHHPLSASVASTPQELRAAHAGHGSIQVIREVDLVFWRAQGHSPHRSEEQIEMM
ncbi:hypothetical protein F4776DRAFT_656685 [Hypoxylon sp. NC0597]|nr:hypothetical protein F4776DRAFT_656685 [Hypoxylon sp. NC0597]